MTEQAQAQAPAPFSYEARAPQRIIGVGNEPAKKVSVLIFGVPKTGKSTWAYMWPAPVVINIMTEGGNAALDTYPQVAQYLISQSKDLTIPPVFNQSAPPRFDIYFSGYASDPANIRNFPPHHCLKNALDMVREKREEWGIATVVLDSVGFLERLWFVDLMSYRYAKIVGKKQAPAAIQAMLKAQGGGGKSYNPGEKWAEDAAEQGGVIFEQRDYGLLSNFHTEIQEKMNAFPCNRIVIGHEKDKLRDVKNSQGRVVGQEKDKTVVALTGASVWSAPAAADLVIQATAQFQTVGRGPAIGRKELVRTYYTSPDEYTAGTVGHRFAFAFPKGKLQDPEFGDMPTFRAVYYAIHEHIALPPQAVAK